MAITTRKHSGLSYHGYIRPPKLNKGDGIGIIAPSSPQRDDERLKNGIRYFESLGYHVELGEHLWKRYGYLAGIDEERLADLNSMIRNPNVRMIIAGRGGYGMTRILHGVDYAHLRRDPKIIVGFSDVTALNCALLAKSKLVSFSGAMPGVDFYDRSNIDPYAEEHFWRAVSSATPPGSIRQPESWPITKLNKGLAEGWLLPANLTLLAAITGTPYLPKPKGAILVLEEIGEEAYRVDRLLSQLDNAGALSAISGLALGAFTGTEPKRISIDPLDIEEVLAEYVSQAAVPAIGNLLYGHIPTKLTLPLGVHARLNGSRGSLQLLESGVV